MDVLAAASLGPSTTHADDSPDMLNDPFAIRLGTFLISSEPIIRLNGENQRGDNLNFEEVLGGGDVTRVRSDADFGGSQRYKMRAIAFSATSGSMRRRSCLRLRSTSATAVCTTIA